MSSRKRLTGYVHVTHKGESVTLSPGQILPRWAEDIVTNPDVLEDANAGHEPDEPDHSRPADVPDGAQIPDDLPALRATAKELGLDARGSADSLRAKIREHVDAEAAKAAEAAASTTEETAAVDLRAKATELGLEVTDETTEAELEALIASKE